MSNVNLLLNSLRSSTFFTADVFVGEVNSDGNEGRGHAVIYCVAASRSIATEEVKGQDVMGSDGKVSCEDAFCFTDVLGNDFVLLERDIRPYKLQKTTTAESKRLQKEIQEAALAKLTPTEREALGFK